MTARTTAAGTLDTILSWDDGRLEAVHDYIQWLFPLDEPSRFNPSAPLLTAHDRAAFRDPELAANLRRALDRMLAFYGFTLDPSAAAAHQALEPMAGALRRVAARRQP